MSIHIRYFGGLVEHTGREEEDRDIPATVGDLEEALVLQYGSGISRGLTASSYLVDGVATTDRSVSLMDAKSVDVLPPFAGG